MWGYISTESSWQTNFNTGFSSTRSDVLVHLAQWQYWWWFWFSFLWCFYFLVVNKTVRARALKMRPKYVTSYRPHGKWGDFLVCIIPVSWCVNILINSNFILRLIEWQNESSLFTIRVRARQWYWVYKFELKSLTDILSTPKNIGNNKWQINVFGELQSTDDYLHILQLRSQNEWIKNYWEDTLKKFNKTKKSNVISFFDYTSNSNLSSINNSDFLLINSNFFFNTPYVFKFNPLFLNNSFLDNDTDNYLNNWNYLWSVFNEDFNSKRNFFFFDNFLIFYKKFLQNTLNIFLNKNFFKLLHNTDMTESVLDVKKQNGSVYPFRLIKNNVGIFFESLNLNTETKSNLSCDLFNYRFNNESSLISDKNVPYTTYLTIKQKRYKRKKNIPSRVQYQIDSAGTKTKLVKRSWKPLLIDNNIFLDTTTDNSYNPTRSYRMLKKNKNRSELFSINTCRRMLRTKRTLVIPAHVNLTIISNSYDVVHSWWIPGLGIKIDCIPGRSTHHTFFVDNVGFYYGQCAEICGRYHHHMPIRICALPFEHFLVWWYSFGLPKLLFTKTRRRFDVIYGFRQYVW